MATPYSTPSFPAPPHPTPASITLNRPQKAPIYNPYDKFTQNEFDSWIGGITGALRRALGQEDEEEQESVTQDHASDLFAPRDDDETEQTPEYEPEEQSEAEDSFQEIKTRRDKGKGRDPREGPGLGGRLQPIEILYSDSDEEESEGEEEVEDDELDEEGEYDWREYDSDGNRYDEYEESEEGYGEEGSGHRIKGDSPEEIIELSSGEEEEEEVDQGPFEDEDMYEDADRHDTPDANATCTLSITSFGQPLSPPDRDEDALGEDELQYPQEEEADEQAFPPRRSPSQPIDLADPWVGPQTYAEDFYSGGDIREGVLDPALVSPSNLTPVRARSEHTWEQDANGLLPRTPIAANKEPIIIDVDMDEEKDEDLLPRSSPFASSPVEEYDSRQAEYVGREGEYDENYEFRDDEAFDEFLGKEAGSERPREAKSQTPSSDIFITAQPQTTQLDPTPISIPIPHHRSSSPPAQGPNGHYDWNFPPAFPAGKVTSGPGRIATPPLNGAPEIIDLVDDEDEDRGDNYDEQEDNDEVEEVEELTSEDEDEEQVKGIGNTSDLIRDVLPEVEEEDIGTREAAEEGSSPHDRAAIDESYAAESYRVDDNREDSDIAHSKDAEISAAQEDATDDVTNDPEIISVGGSEESATDEVHEVPADVRFKASLLENFLATADTVAEPTWNGNKVHGEVTNWEQPPTSPIAKIRTVEDNSWGGSVGPSAIEILSEEDDAHVVDDTQPQIESPTADAAHNDPTELAQEDPDDQDKSNESPQTILVEPLNQEGLHYTVSEVMTDDGRHSTVPPDERDADVVSVADDHSGGLVPYIVEEPVSEGRQTEEPAEQVATDGAQVDVTMDSLKGSDADDAPILATMEHSPDLAFGETVEAELAPQDDICSNHHTPSQDVTPAAGSVKNTLIQDGEITVPAWHPPEEERDEEARNQYDFPMPILANPSVPEPVGISRTPDTHISPTSSLMDPEAPRDSIHDSIKVLTETSLIVPPFPLGPSVRQESFSTTSTSGLFTPQNEAATVPESADPQPAEPSAIEDDAQLTHTADSERLTPAMPEVSSAPLETMDAMDVSNAEALDADIFGTASVRADEAFFHPVPPPGVAQPLDAVEDEDDPFKLMGNDSKVAPGAVEDQPGAGEGKDEPIDDVQPLSPDLRDEEQGLNHEIVNREGTSIGQDQEATVAAASFYQNGASLPPNGVQRTDSQDSVGSQQSKPSKRKRALPQSIPARLTRSMSSRTPIVDYKGKSKAEAENDAASETGSSSSSASVASKMLRMPSRDTSRASSVVSTAQSVESSTFSAQQSPTLARQTNNKNARSEPPILYHVHSGLHHHHSRPSSVSRPSQIPKHPVASPSQPKNASAQPSTSQPSPSQRTAAVVHSPVTRSNCRFHRISLPREEGGPRVSFIVPGCSLGDRTLMDEEYIEDEGDATTLDHARMVGDIETLDFSSDLMGILRQLVGVDLLRENEIFYLPQPGATYRRKRHGKSKLYTARSSSGDLATSLGSQNVASSPRGPTASKISPSSSSMQAPVSAVGSVSTSTGSTGRNGRELDRHSPSRPSYSDDDMTELADNGGSQKKRRKGMPANRDGVASSEEMPPPTQSKTAAAQPGPKARRSKRLSIDASAYKPESDAEGASTDHDSDTTKGLRKKIGKRGIKRNRTSESVGADGSPGQPTAKRLRARLSSSSNGGQ